MRADLLALNTDALAALTNRGLVKRAEKAIGAGEVPVLETDPDGTIRAVMPDGVRTVLPLGGFEAARCTCGAAGHCRHTLMLVLAYQAGATGPEPEAAADWTPGTFTDEDVEAVIGTRSMAAARRTARTGYVATVHRPGADDPVPHVDLPACTVRFLVPGDLGYVHSDAAHAATGEALALAVWAFRAADAADPAARRLRVDIGTGGPARSAALDGAVALADDLLMEGTVNAGGLVTAVAAVARALDAERLRWPQLAVAEIAEQLDAYAQRSARYRAERFAELLAEVYSRYRASGSGARSGVLGTDEPAETRMRAVRLTGLGGRIRAAGPEHTAEVFFADPATATVLVLRHQWTVADGQTPPPAAGRRIAGATLGALATGNVVTESAVRTASRRVRLPAGRLSRNSVLGSQGDWAGLPPGVLADDLAALTTDLDRLPPRLIRPRIDAEAVRVIAVQEVRSISYAPGEQRLDAVVADASGTTAVVSAEHRGAAPGALDALAEALPEARFVSGVVRRGRGGLVIAPLAVVRGSVVVVPDFAAAAGSLAVERTGGRNDAMGAAIEDGIGLLAEVAHRGGRHLPPTYPQRLRASAVTLGGTGLARSAQALEAVAAACGVQDTLPRVWADAMIRLLVTAESR